MVSGDLEDKIDFGDEPDEKPKRVRKAKPKKTKFKKLKEEPKPTKRGRTSKPAREKVAKTTTTKKKKKVVEEEPKPKRKYTKRKNVATADDQASREAAFHQLMLQVQALQVIAHRVDIVSQSVTVLTGIVAKYFSEQPTVEAMNTQIATLQQQVQQQDQWIKHVLQNGYNPAIPSG